MKNGLKFVRMCLLFALLLSAVIIGLTPAANAEEPFFKDPAFIQVVHEKATEQGYSLLKVLPSGGRYYVKEVTGSRTEKDIPGYLYRTFGVGAKGEVVDEPAYIGETGIIAVQCNNVLYYLLQRKYHYAERQPKELEKVDPDFASPGDSKLASAIRTAFCQ